jgi:hypothetical protein
MDISAPGGSDVIEILIGVTAATVTSCAGSRAATGRALHVEVYGHLMQESKQAIADSLNPVPVNFATKMANILPSERPN